MYGNEVNPTPTTTKSSVATLSNLGITPNDFSGFKSYIYSYDVEIPNEVESVEVYATKGQSGQTITGTGTKSLEVGKNTIVVTVTAEDGTTKKEYTLNIIRQEAETEETEETEENTDNIEDTEEVFGLTELTIEGLELEPQFQTDVYDYTVELEEDLEKLNITTLATSVNSTIEITGNENLIEGENTITIMVKNTDTEEIVTYQIIVNKVLSIVEEESNKGIDKEVLILAAIAIVILILIIILIVRHIKQNKGVYGQVPYIDLNDEDDEEEEDDDDEDEEDDDEYIEKKTKSLRGKRFK